MPGLSEILEVARRALMIQRVSLETTSHNIANAGTVGYSRQRVDLTPSSPLRTSYGMLGTGVSISHIGRLRDQFVDRQIRTANQSMGEASGRESVLRQIEGIIQEPTTYGLSNALSEFFNAFHDLAAHPEEGATRMGVLGASRRLVASFHTLSTGLEEVRTNILGSVEMKLERINQLAKEISELDIQISNATAVGLDPGDAKDQRDLRIEELSTLAAITVSEDSRGSVIVSIGGTAIASGAGAVELSADISGGMLTVRAAGSADVVRIQAGELDALLSSYNTTIPDYRSRLDALAGAVIGRVNSIHTAGFGLGTPPPTGVAFFAGSDAATIAINPLLEADANTIAASADGTPGNNAVALALAGIVDERLLGGNTSTLGEYYNTLVADVGSSLRAAADGSEAQRLLLTDLENQRASISGVSLDEEMTNMIKFQRSYDAAATMVSTVDEMFQTILNMV